VGGYRAGPYPATFENILFQALSLETSGLRNSKDVLATI
jgi:hypothetical protein